MRKLYEIRDDLLACIDDETGEIVDIEKLNALLMEKETKLEGVTLCIKDYKYEVGAIKEEIDKLTARKKTLENKIESLKNWLTFALDGEKLRTPRCYVYQTHSTKVSVADEAELIDYFKKTEEPDKFLRFKDPELKLNEIKNALKSGEIIPGAVLEETESIVIK
jgi:hypothetical protein